MVDQGRLADRVPQPVGAGANPERWRRRRTRTSPSWRTQHGFRFEGVNGAELDHVRVTDVYGDFVYLGRDKHKVPSRNVWIHDSTFLRNGRQGIAVTAATNVIVEHNSLRRHAALDDRPRAERPQLARLERVRARQHRREGSPALRRVARSRPGEQRRDLGQPPARPSAHDRRAAAREAAALQLGGHQQCQQHDGAQPADALRRHRRARREREHAARARASSRRS